MQCQSKLKLTCPAGKLIQISMKNELQNPLKRNKEDTKRRLIHSVGVVMNNHGFKALTISKIAREAQVDRKLIHRYFGGLNGLIECYIVENDYWMIFAGKLKEIITEYNEQSAQLLMTSILVDQFNSFYNGVDMQNLILWELTSKSPLMRSIHNTREMLGKQLLELTDPHFDKSPVNFRAIAALLVGGIYYTVLHTRHNGGMFSDINVTTDKGRNELTVAIGQIVDWAYGAKQ
jgi:AcrR family transcriptional regulator